MDKANLKNRVKDGSKRNVQRVIYGRTMVIVLLLLVQMALFASMIFWLKDYSTSIYFAFQAIAVVTVVLIMNRRENPAFKLSWIVLILVTPVLGAALYIFVQNQFGFKVTTWRVKVLKSEVQPFLKQKSEVIDQLSKESVQECGLANYVKYACDHPVYRHTNVTYFPVGEDKIDCLMEELKKAEKYIFMEYFIVKEGVVWDSILDILLEKAKQGVEVRFMYDGLCTFTDMPVNYPKKLQEQGIQCKVFAPIRPILSSVQNNRDHRKIVVIDGKMAFTGGVNLADEYVNEVVRFGHWKDTAIMIKGEAVKSFTMMFLTMWNITEKRMEKYEDYIVPSNDFQSVKNDGYMIPYGDCPFDDYNVAKHIYLSIINNATKYVYFMTPYLILDNEVLEALCFAARRGVDVRILLPHIPDKKYAFWLAKSFYKELLLGGVKLYEYTPGFVHAKEVVSDDIRGVVGTSNLDFRSLYLHYECGMYMYDCSELAKIKEDYMNCMEISHEVTMYDCRNERLRVKIIGSILRVFAPLM